MIPMSELSEQKIKVTIETQDGNIYNATALACEISMEPVIHPGNFKQFGLGHPLTTIENNKISISMDVVGDLTVEKRDQFIKSHKELPNAQEWECSFCHRPNQREDETCKSCGAIRSFIYDIKTDPGIILFDKPMSSDDVELIKKLWNKHIQDFGLNKPLMVLK